MLIYISGYKHKPILLTSTAATALALAAKPQAIPPTNRVTKMDASSSKIVLWNHQSNMMLEHYNGERVEAVGHFTMDSMLPNCQWYRMAHATDKGGFFLYKNAGTDRLLGHYLGEPMQACDDCDDLENEHCQWEEIAVDATDANSFGLITLKNRATGFLLDHHREQSIRADSTERTTPTQQWVLQFMNAEDILANEPVTAAPDLDRCDVVSIKNFGSGKVLEHYEGERIEAYSDETSLSSGEIRVARKASFAKWYRIPLANGFYAYRNLTTSKVLELYGGESVQAFSLAETHLASHQWKELEVSEGGLAYMRGPGSEGGLMALQNCASGKFLCHRTNKPVQVVVDDEDEEGYKKDKALQWVVFWLRRVPEEPVA